MTIAMGTGIASTARRRAAVGWAGRLVLLAVLALGTLPAWPGTAHADDPVFVRLYYSSWMTGRVDRSPADPTGAFSNEMLTQNPDVGVEAIFMRRLGLSFTRQKLLRDFSDPAGSVAGCAAAPCQVSENGVQQAVNLTLYGRPVQHDQFNLFAGGGAGSLDYGYRTDGTAYPGGDLFKSLSLSRWFFGLEYTYDRIGFRIEISHASASQTIAGQKAELGAAYRYLTLVIPLN
ncbi:MAG TPA: hypothetical protein VKB51_19145 [bacterium]|nr:hypothetical protein [bacterium]